MCILNHRLLILLLSICARLFISALQTGLFPQPQGEQGQLVGQSFRRLPMHDGIYHAGYQAIALVVQMNVVDKKIKICP